jgi:hypothetical protein
LLDKSETLGCYPADLRVNAGEWGAYPLNVLDNTFASGVIQHRLVPPVWVSGAMSQNVERNTCFLWLVGLFFAIPESGSGDI